MRVSSLLCLLFLSILSALACTPPLLQTHPPPRSIPPPTSSIKNAFCANCPLPQEPACRQSWPSLQRLAQELLQPAPASPPHTPPASSASPQKAPSASLLKTTPPTLSKPHRAASRPVAPTHAQSTSQPARQETPLLTRLRKWDALLSPLHTHAACLPQETRQAYRQLLEIESDRDRARFPQFPEHLSTRIIHAIISLDQAALAKGKIPQRPTMTLDEFAPHVAPPPTHQAKGDDTDSDHRPPLVFTEKDIERFQAKRVFLRWPVRGSVSSGFGLRIDPFRRKQSFHQGLDIGARFGAPVHAAANGKVLRHGWLGSCGMGVLIEHEGGFRSLYCHLSQILAQLYENVQAGQQIGKIGSTGRSTSPHLHFGLFLNGRAVDPIPYLPSKD